MLDLTPVLERLAATCPTFKDIDSAVNQPDAINKLGRMPALYVLEATLRAQPCPVGSSLHIQKVTESFDVIYKLNVKGAVAGTSARAKQLVSFKKRHTDEVWAALVGWTWDPLIAPISIVSGQLIDLDSERMIFSERFETWSQYRATRTTLYP